MTATVRSPRSSRGAAPVRARPEPRRAAPSKPDLRIVPEPRPRSKAGAIGALAVSCVFGALFLNAGFHAVLVSNQADLDRLHRNVAAEEARNERLHLEVAQLEAPDRVVEAAERAGMVQPAQTYWLAPRGDGGATIASVSERATPPPPEIDDGVGDETAADGTTDDGTPGDEAAAGDPSGPDDPDTEGR